MSSDELPVEKGVPMPAARQGRPPKYPFQSMDVGDSFFVVAGAPDRNRAESIRMAARYRGIRVSIRSVDGGLRVWRTK